MNEPDIKPIPSENKPEDKKFKKLPHHKVLFKPPFTAHVEGMIGAGKTAWAWSMLSKHYKGYFDEVIVYCGTMDSKEHWEKLPHKNVAVLHTWDSREFDEYIKQLEIDQEKRKEKGKRMLNVCILFDDMASEGLQKHSAGKHSALERLMLICRHLNCSVIILTQDSKICMNPAMRNNCFYHILYRVQRNDIEKISKEHCGDLTPEQFIRMYYSVIDSAPYQFLLIDYKAPPEKRFKQGFTKVIKVVHKPLLEDLTKDRKKDDKKEDKTNSPK
jgi:hypothetical protein